MNKQAALMKILTTKVEINNKYLTLMSLLKNVKKNVKGQQDVNSGLGQNQVLPPFRSIAT
jgi:hypothetical protein